MTARAPVDRGVLEVESVDRPTCISFDVRGLPVPQGSTRAFVPKGWDHAVVTSSAKGLGAWRRLVADVAQRYAPPELWDGPVSVALRFRVPKPKSSPKRRRTWPAKRPDLDKLVRAVLDALTHVVFRDDAQVVQLLAEKDYGPAPGVHVTVARVLEAVDRPTSMSQLAAGYTIRRIQEDR